MLLRAVLLLGGSVALWSPVEAKECYSCIGETCVQASTIATVITCPNENDLCYTRFDAATLLPTERGCLMQAMATVSCVADDCVSCDSDDLCNELSHPKHRCAVCSSVASEDCVSNPSALQDVQCPAVTGVDLTAAQCFSRVIESVTLRGCINSRIDVDRCFDADCATCIGTGCNKIEFPTDRQQCIRCTDPASCDADTTSIEYCEDPYDHCVTLRRANGNVEKACEKALSTEDTAYCQANPTQCAFCGKQRCNSVPFSTVNSVAQNEMSCYRCVGTGCLKTSAFLATCRLFDDDCFSTFSGFNPNRRGCASELSVQEMRSCKEAQSTGPECAICSEAECNLESRADHRCVQCSSVEGAFCTAPSGSDLPIVQCPAPTTEILPDAQCLIRVVDSITERLCISGASDLLGCEEDGSNCATCGIETDGEGCNSRVFPADRRRCSIGSTANDFCPNPWDDCVQLLLQDGTRKRTCRSLLPETERSYCAANSNRCHFCSTDNCNAPEVSFNYVECLSCDSSTDPRCATSPSALTTFTRCTTGCASAIIPGTVPSTQSIWRGCLASLPVSAATSCPVTAGSTCQRCATNRCNAVNFPSDRLSCFRCTHPPCASHQSVRQEFCPVYHANDSCLLQTDASGQLLRLDCRSSLTTTELAVCDSSARLCRACSSPGCNDPTALTTTGSCVRCRSSLNPLCRDRAANVLPEPCADPTNAVCYSRVLSDGDTERGCMSDLTTVEQSACTRGDRCLVCDSRTQNNCNSSPYPVAPLGCFQCDSRSDGDSCKAAQQSGSAPDCPNYDPANRCYTVVRSNGDTVRKCSTASRETECAEASACEVCLFRGCNGKASSDVGYPVDPPKTTTPGPSSGGTTGGVLATPIVVLWLAATLANSQ